MQREVLAGPDAHLAGVAFDGVGGAGGKAEHVADGAEEKIPARDHGHDFDEMKRAADRLDHYAHLLRRLHDSELGQNWRQESRQDTPRPS